MKEISCGAVIYRKEDRAIKYLLLHYEAGHWDFVKGNVEKGEKCKGTVIREAKEETGINDLKFLRGFEEKISYFYRPKGKTIYKEVTFLLAETATEKIKLSFEHKGHKWLHYNEAVKQLTFPTARKVLEKAQKRLQQKTLRL
jgi:8-oxo-dGTP pyrophosphatase MutT (NUDIX family)